ncbi:MAG: hypothetical protein ABR520_01190 [Mycobacteriales bacterium]|nr:hypothetical protein [Frankia sp.]
MRLSCPRGRVHRSLALLGLATSLASHTPDALGSAPTGVLRLPAPQTAETFGDVPGVIRIPTRVPGPVANVETVVVSLRPDGSLAEATVRQALTLTGTGDFIVREPAGAVDVTALDDTSPPVLQRGTVVWQGFVPGRKRVAAAIQLDAAVEAARIPLLVSLRFVPAGGGAPTVIAADGTVPGAGDVVVELTNQTGVLRAVPTGDVPAAALHGPLDRLRVAAARPAPPPVAGRGLPAMLRGTAVGSRTVESVAPLRVTGTLAVVGAGGVQVDGATADGEAARLHGVLTGSARIVIHTSRAGRLALDLGVQPGLHPDQVRPLRGRTWSEWAARHPDAAARRRAVDMLMDAAASAARDAEVSPYLRPGTPWSSVTVFRYRLASRAAPPPMAPPLRPRRGAVALACLAFAAVVGNAAVVWRRL